VKDQVLQFKNLIDEVLNGAFHLILPSTFKKVHGIFSVVAIKNDESKGKD
jgi:hypothetical protein